MIDAVLSYHTNGALCGVAKFNQRLAKELGVPCLQLNDYESTNGKHVLVSIKPSEIPSGDCYWVANSYDLFLHDSSEWVSQHPIAAHARAVYAGNSVIARDLRRHRPDVIEAWCPSTIEGNPHRGTINVLTFGMAHKIQTHHYEKLKALLDATGEDYTVSVSTAIHEGSPWDETSLVAERLRAVFGNNLRSLGYLADDALARELRDCTAVALFFDPALRANNTSYWAAVEAHKAVITNCDDDSPYRGDLEIDYMESWPDWLRGQATAIRYPMTHTWDQLIEKLQAVPCAK